MTINNFISKSPAGLFCIPGNFYLDPTRSVEHAVVSHAHGDHAVPTSQKIVCTAPTFAFMKERHGEKCKDQFTLVAFDEAFEINGVQLTFYPAGHMLGSAQILMEYNGERYLYTGDFKTEPDPSCEPFRFVECDYLITETTFASPEYTHPDPSAALAEIMEHGSSVVIGAYAIGKAQRLTALITRHFAHVPVYVHPVLKPFHLIYQDHGFDLGNWSVYNRAEFKNTTPCMYILPPADFRRYSRNKEVLKVFATGWKRSFYACDRVLPVSDHADWKSVLELVERSKAKKVFTVHGDGKFLKQHYSGSNIEVTEFGK